jgi:hypothetical protein
MAPLNLAVNVIFILALDAVGRIYGNSCAMDSRASPEEDSREISGEI